MPAPVQRAARESILPKRDPPDVMTAPRESIRPLPPSVRIATLGDTQTMARRAVRSAKQGGIQGPALLTAANVHQAHTQPMDQDLGLVTNARF